jgi:hypothetical protein
MSSTLSLTSASSDFGELSRAVEPSSRRRVRVCKAVILRQAQGDYSGLRMTILVSGLSSNLKTFARLLFCEFANGLLHRLRRFSLCLT